MRLRVCFILLSMLALLTPIGGMAGQSAPRVSARLTATDTVDDLLFGHHVALLDNIIAVAARGSRASGAPRPATYIFFKKPDGGWVQKQEIAAGGALSLRDSRLLIGSALYRLNDARVFVERARLAPRQSQSHSGFGRAVALFSGGRRAAVAAPFERVNGVASAGAVYIFHRTSDSGWVQVARLTAPAPAQGQHFGLALAADGTGTLLIGAPIARDAGKAGAYLFRRESDGWRLAASFTGSNGTGRSVALDDDTALVGTDGGPVRVYTRKAGGQWSRQGTLKRPSGQTGEFGFEVALGGDRALVGFPPGQMRANSSNATNPGRAVLYVRQANGAWTESAEFGPYDESRNLGFTVGLDHDAFIVADPMADTLGHERAGVVYVLTTGVDAGASNSSADGGGGLFGVAGLAFLLAAAGWFRCAGCGTVFAADHREGDS